MWKNWNPKSIVAVIMALTVSLVLIISTAAALFYPPGTVTETFRQKIFEILIFIVGTVSGWLLGKAEPTQPPSDKPKE